MLTGLFILVLALLFSSRALHVPQVCMWRVVSSVCQKILNKVDIGLSPKQLLLLEHSFSGYCFFSYYINLHFFFFFHFTFLLQSDASLLPLCLLKVVTYLGLYNYFHRLTMKLTSTEYFFFCYFK